MNKVLIKVILILLIVMFVFSFITSVNATGNADIVKQSFGGSDGNIEGSKPITQILSAILGVVRTVGAAVAILVLMTIGAKYIIASAGDRADIKKYAINYIIGAIILLGATGILSVVKNFVDSAL